jgi:hypothetical protein
VLVDDRFFIIPLIFFLIQKCHKITLYKKSTMNTPNLCRPGHGASCALCCGSHNYNAPFEEIHALLKSVVKSLSFTAANTLQNASEPVGAILPVHTTPLALLMKALSSHSPNYTRMGFNAHL